MKATPLFLGACALASIAGAVGGATTNTIPLQGAGIGSELIPSRSAAFDPSDTGSGQEMLPDHYAITTPEGRIEVADLSTRGLYAQQRFGWREAELEAAPEPTYAELEPLEWQASQPATTEDQMTTAPEPPLDLAEPAVATVTPRIIDVAATLAARD